MTNVLAIHPAIIEERVCPLAHVVFLYPNSSFLKASCIDML